MNEPARTVKRLFFIDGVGALITAAMLTGVLITFEPVFGMPTRILVPLSGVAAGFAIYSLTCAVTGRGPGFLLAIAAANTLYCIVTLTLVALFRQSLTGLGVAYFVGEVLVVMSLVAVEIRAVRRRGAGGQMGGAPEGAPRAGL